MDISLAGCVKGLIPNRLKQIISKTDNPPIGWSLDIETEYNSLNESVIIDIKPKNNEVFLCELDTVFGFSYEEWTPIMYRLKRLYNGILPGDFNKESFVYPTNTETLYTILYMLGSFKDGELTGTWNPPFGTITAVLFWPEAMTYFYQKVRQYDSDFLSRDVRILESLQ